MRFLVLATLLAAAVVLAACDADRPTQLEPAAAPTPSILADLQPLPGDSCRWNARLFAGSHGNYAGSTCNPDSTWVDVWGMSGDSIASLEAPATGYGCARDPGKAECWFKGYQISNYYGGLGHKLTAMGTCEAGSADCDYVQVKFVPASGCCNDNQCTEEGKSACENLYTNTCKECVNNGYCTAGSDSLCVDYACVECASDSNCTSPEECVGGVCMFVCSPDPTCTGRSCTTSGDCTNGTCPDGRCMPNGTCSCPS